MIHPRLRRAWLALLPAILATACASTQKDAEAPGDLDLYASAGVNRDSRGRPSPILVGIYGLKSTAAFDASGFTALQDHPRTALGEDLVSVEQMILLPGERKRIPAPRDPAVRQIGVVAGYRELGRTVWKTTFAPPAGEARGHFSFWPYWPFAPERVDIRMELGEGGLAVRTMSTTNRTY
jgi:type VI secretion system protein VasD